MSDDSSTIAASADALVSANLDSAPHVIINGLGSANALVTNGWNSAQAFANNAYTQALAFLNQLESAAVKISTIPDVDADLDDIELDITGLDSLLAEAPLTPGINFQFDEDVYQDNLLTALTNTLYQWVNGASTGIAPNVEAAIWERARVREAANTNRKVQEAIRTFAMRGFAKPPGALAVETQAAIQESVSANSTVSRDAAIKQAELEQSNRRFSMEQAWKVQEGLIQYMSQRMARALETAKALQQFYVDVYAQDVNKLNALVQEYKARVDAEVSVFRAEIDKNIAEANLRVENSKLNLSRMLQQATLLIEAIKAGAQVSAQLAASALSAVNLSGGVHYSESVSASESDSRSSSVSAAVTGSQGSASQYNYTP